MTKTLTPSKARSTQSNGEATTATPSRVASIARLRIEKVHVTIVGKTSLIVHAWSAKAVRQMLDKQMGTATAGREKKNPVNDFKESLYRLPNNAGLGFPSICFKAAAVSAANDVSLKMTECRRSIHVNAELVKIIADPLPKELYTDWDLKHAKEIEFEHQHGCQMRMDMVRLESGVADIRFRGCFPKWKCLLEVEYNANAFSLDQVVNLINAAGQSGVGEWRPSSPQVRSGEFGRFAVEESQ